MTAYAPESPERSGVVALILTYGSRKHHLEKVLASLDTSEIVPERVIVVDNGHVSRFDRAITRKYSVQWVDLPTNLGSAGGYRAGLLEAFKTNLDIWLLDDDNSPAPDCLRLLLESRRKLGERSIVVANRPSRPEFQEILRRGGSRPIRHNSFMAFHLLGTPPGHQLRTPPNEGCFPLTYFGYGSALIPREAGSLGILPNPALFVYHDDSDWSHRLIQAGFTAWLVPDAIVTDLEAPLGGKDASGSGRLFSHKTDALRVWYAVRNRAWVEHHLGFGGIGWHINASTWIVLQGLRSWWQDRQTRDVWRKIRLAFRAFRVGSSGKLIPFEPIIPKQAAGYQTRGE